jgi:hypothetical protein
MWKPRRNDREAKGDTLGNHVETMGNPWINHAETKTQRRGASQGTMGKPLGINKRNMRKPTGNDGETEGGRLGIHGENAYQHASITRRWAWDRPWKPRLLRSPRGMLGPPPKDIGGPSINGPLPHPRCIVSFRAPTNLKSQPSANDALNDSSAIGPQRSCARSAPDRTRTYPDLPIRKL